MKALIFIGIFANALAGLFFFFEGFKYGGWYEAAWVLIWIVIYFVEGR